MKERQKQASVCLCVGGRENETGRSKHVCVCVCVSVFFTRLQSKCYRDRRGRRNRKEGDREGKGCISEGMKGNKKKKQENAMLGR